MEKKYYDLIISLIKEHKKYSGYEPILEDIANDVYEHSKVIFGTISNEDVIKAYLNKTISISIVTVPKRLNFSNKNRVRDIRTITITPPQVVRVEQVQTVSESVVQTIAKTSVPEPTEVNVSEFFAIENSPTEENALIDYKQNDVVVTEEPVTFEVETVDTQDVLFEQNVIEDKDEILEEAFITEVEELSFENSEEDKDEAVIESIEESTIEEISIPEENSIIDLVEQNDVQIEEIYEEKEVNKTFVDMMINGVPTETPVEEELESSEEIIEVGQVYEELESFDIEDNVEDEFLSIDDSSEDNLSLESESFDVDNSDLIAEENVAEEDEGIELEKNSNMNLEQVDDFKEQDEAEDIEELDTYGEIEEFVELEENLDAEASLELDNSDDFVISDVDSEETEEIIQEELVVQEYSYNTPSYDYFDYTPIKTNYDTEEIYAELVDLDNKHPERKIMQICDLKYNHKMSISEIAEKLNFTKDDVISILSEIVNIVKE
ncbi:hypothetical protein IJ384_01210 [bacterium]|nr:hypothetical protein [bacterium]